MGANTSTNNGRRGRANSTYLGTPHAPKAFYVVIGTPSISYRTPGKGPLIYNVELPQEKGPQQVETAATVNNYFNVTHKSGMRLEQINRLEPKQGFRLSFLVDGTPKIPCTVSIYAGVHLQLERGSGLVLSPESKEQVQFVVVKEAKIEADAHGLQFNCDHPIFLQYLKPFRISDRFNASQQTGDDGGAAYAPLVIQLSYVAPAVYEEPEPTDAGPTSSAETTPGQSPPVATAAATGASFASAVGATSPSTASNRSFTNPSPAGETNRSPKELAPKRKQVVTVCLKFEPSRYDKLHAEHDDPLNNPKIVISGARSFLQFDNEVYEVNDVFDAGEGGVVAPREQSQVREDAGAVSPTLASAQESAIVEEEEEEANTCVVCLTAPKDTTVLPCRHLCLCSECAAMVKHSNNKCPVCRGPIDKLMALKLPKR